MNCNFDNSLCTWTQLLTDVFNWTRHRGPTPTSMTGPLSDHTTGSKNPYFFFTLIVIDDLYEITR